MLPNSFVVRGGRASAVIDTAPFRMRVLDGGGRTVLASVAPVATASLANESVLPPLPGQHSSPEAAPAYAPLSYVVGVSSVTAQAAGLWQGDLVAANTVGTTYEPTAVVSASQTSSGAVFTLATNEPGRLATLTVLPEANGLRFTLSFDDPTGIVETAAAFASASNEGFYGFGGRHAGLDQYGYAVPTYLSEEDENPVYAPGSVASLSSSLGTSNYLFPDGPEAAYNVSAAFASSRGYGFVLRRPELSEYRLGIDRADAWRVDLRAATLDFSVQTGDAPSIVAAQTALTGRQIEPPTWALGPTIDRNYPATESSASDYYTHVQADLANIATYHPPITAYRLEGWAMLTSAQVQAVVSQLHAMGVHMLVYLNDYAGGYLTPVTTQQALAGSYEVKNAQGLPYLITTTSGTPTVILDFTNPATQAFWNGVVASALDTGADGFMEDFGEQVMPDMVFANGETGLTMHNAYPIAYHRATRAALDAYAHAHPNRSVFSYVRSSFTGSASYESGNFPGDETTDFGAASGLASLAPDMLNRSVGGSFGYTTDIGGYFDDLGPTSKELFIRWAEWSVFTPFFRLHDDGLDGTKMPWDFDADTVAKFNALAALHARFVPLIDALWQNADRTGAPIVRPLWYAYPNDSSAVAQTQEWLLGSDILVAPVVTSGATSNAAYLPAGCWQDQRTMQRYSGPRTVVVPAPLGSVPYFFRCGTHPA